MKIATTYFERYLQHAKAAWNLNNVRFNLADKLMKCTLRDNVHPM